MGVYDIAMKEIEGIKNFKGRKVTLNSHHIDVFRQYCTFLDDLAKQFNVREVKVRVDEELKTIVSFRAWCFEGSRKSILYHLIMRCCSVEFKPGIDSSIIMELKFPVLWNV